MYEDSGVPGESPDVIEPAPGGVIVSIRVIPRAQATRLDGVRGGALLVRLQAAPVDGTANEALVAVLAESFGVPKRNVTIVSGERSREKRVMIRGVDATTARAICEVL